MPRPSLELFDANIRKKMEQTKKSGRGGRREGAGRKVIGEHRSATITLCVTPATKTKLRKLATDKGVSIGRLIEMMIECLELDKNSYLR